MTTTVSIAETAPFRLCKDSIKTIRCCTSALFQGVVSRSKDWLSGHPNLVALFAQAKWLNDRQLPTLEQQVLTDFISEGI